MWVILLTPSRRIFEFASVSITLAPDLRSSAVSSRVEQTTGRGGRLWSVPNVGGYFSSRYRGGSVGPAYNVVAEGNQDKHQHQFRQD